MATENTVDIYDRYLHALDNDRKQNFWYVYSEEILDQLGLRVAVVEPKE